MNVLMGGNATGKTSIGRMLMAICNFIDRKEAVYLRKRIADKSKEESVTMDFVGNEYKMYRIDIRVLPESRNVDSQVEVCIRVIDIGKRDRYETCVEKLERMPIEFQQNYVEELTKVEPIGWLFAYPADDLERTIACPEIPGFSEVLEYTLKALDPAIKKVEKLKEVDNTYIIH